MSGSPAIPGIANGENVTWRTYPNAPGTAEHTGEVIAFLPAMSPVPGIARPHMQGLAFVTMLAIVPRKQLLASRMARYLIRTGDKEWRLPSASLVDRQNPQARKAVPRG